jgi:hypothetical protein
MRSHWYHRLAGLAAAIAVALSVGPVHHAIDRAPHAAAMADPVCPAGTNWDNILNTCV